jgi:hypothetical protein
MGIPKGNWGIIRGKIGKSLKEKGKFTGTWTSSNAI